MKGLDEIFDTLGKFADTAYEKNYLWLIVLALVVLFILVVFFR